MTAAEAPNGALPYYLPPPAEIHPENRIKVMAMAALDAILFKEHRRAMRLFPDYRERIERRPKEQRDIVGLGIQQRRFALQSQRRHREIWAAIRAYDESHTLKQKPSFT